MARDKLRSAMITRFASLPGLLLSALLAAQGIAQTTSPTTRPATTQRVRWQITLPPGFVKVAVGDRLAICDAADEAWVKEALTSAPPATKPTTMPADLLDRLASHRAALVKQMSTDFAVSDPS